MTASATELLVVKKASLRFVLPPSPVRTPSRSPERSSGLWTPGTAGWCFSNFGGKNESDWRR
jgi:hypothetical protein